MEQGDNWTTLLQRPTRCRQPRSNTFRDEIGRSPRASTTTRKMQANNSYLHKIAVRDTGTCDSCGEAETTEHCLFSWFAERNCSSSQEYMRSTKDQLHITDDPTSGSRSGSDPSLDSPTVMTVNHGSEAWRRTQLISNPTLTVIAIIASLITRLQTLKRLWVYLFRYLFIAHTAALNNIYYSKIMRKKEYTKIRQP